MSVRCIWKRKHAVLCNPSGSCFVAFYWCIAEFLMLKKSALLTVWGCPHGFFCSEMPFWELSSSCHGSIAVVYEFGFSSPLAVMPLQTDEKQRILELVSMCK